MLKYLFGVGSFLGIRDRVGNKVDLFLVLIECMVYVIVWLMGFW